MLRRGFIVCYAPVIADLVLRLRREEKAAFDGLPTELKRGWKVEEETLEAFERPEELAMRYQIARFDDPHLRKLVAAAREAKTPEEFEKAASGFDFSALPQEQMAEVFFMLGTVTIGRIVRHVLAAAKVDDDLQGIAGLTEIRHMLLEANAIPV